jgi:hypothetical protein
VERLQRGRLEAQVVVEPNACVPPAGLHDP